MKNVNDLMELLNKAIQNNSKEKTWFFSYSGHVQLIDVRLYPDGWRSYDELKNSGESEPKFITKSCYLDYPENIEEMYYWIKFKLSEE